MITHVCAGWPLLVFALPKPHHTSSAIDNANDATRT
jgi:hypothetical protein